MGLRGEERESSDWELQELRFTVSLLEDKGLSVPTASCPLLFLFSSCAIGKSFNWCFPSPGPTCTKWLKFLGLEISFDLISGSLIITLLCCCLSSSVVRKEKCLLLLVLSSCRRLLSDVWGTSNSSWSANLLRRYTKRIFSVPKTQRDPSWFKGRTYW